MKSLFYKIIYLFLTFLLLSSQSFCGEITWKFFIGSTSTSGVIYTKTAAVGQEIYFDESDCVSIPSSSSELINALDNTSFLIQSLPVNKNISINVILNAKGNKFEPAMSVSVFINIGFEVYIDGVRQDDFTLYSGSPLIITIRSGSGLNYLLNSASCSTTDNLIAVYYTGGKFYDDNISLSTGSSGLVIRARNLNRIVCGKDLDLGFPSSVKIDTWSKIKLLFK